MASEARIAKVRKKYRYKWNNSGVQKRREKTSLNLWRH